MNEENMYNLNIERAVLSAVLFEPESYEYVATKLQPHDFYLPFHQHLLGVMATLSAKELPIEEEFIRSGLIKIGKFDEVSMLDILSANPISNTAAYVDEIKAKSSKRALAALAVEIKRSVIEGTAPVGDVLEVVSKKIDDIQNSNTISTLTAEDFFEIYTSEKYEAKPKNIKNLDGTAGIFYAGGIHMIYGLSKEGKTTAALEILDKVTTHKIIWLDGDNNFNDKAEHHKNIKHFRPLKPNEWIDKLIASNVDFSNYVLIIDSLKNFTGAESMDTNDGMNAILHRMLDVNRLGATVVVIHHATEREGKAVLKGNKELLYSAMDVTYIFKRDKDKNKRTLFTDRSRIPKVESGTVFEFDTYVQEWTTIAKLPITDISERKKTYNKTQFGTEDE